MRRLSVLFWGQRHIGLSPCQFSVLTFHVQDTDAALDPLLRSAGNMASSTAAATVLGAPQITSAISQIQQHEIYRQEASWVLTNLAAANGSLHR